MKTRAITIGLIVVVAGLVARFILTPQPEPKIVSLKPQSVAPTLVPQQAFPEDSLPLPALPVAPTPRPVGPTLGPVDKRKVLPPANPQIQQPAPQPGPQPADPNARIALALVGEDPKAEAYWEDAIFDTSLPDKERDDLMEDLNEVGFADPQNPGPEDLPLILNRVALIEELAPYTDDFMARHLGEAYKDLVEMAAKASRGQ